MAVQAPVLTVVLKIQYKKIHLLILDNEVTEAGCLWLPLSPALPPVIFVVGATHMLHHSSSSSSLYAFGSDKLKHKKDQSALELLDKQRREAKNNVGRGEIWTRV